MNEQLINIDVLLTWLTSIDHHSVSILRVRGHLLTFITEVTGRRVWNGQRTLVVGAAVIVWEFHTQRIVWFVGGGTDDPCCVRVAIDSGAEEEDLVGGWTVDGDDRRRIRSSQTNQF